MTNIDIDTPIESFDQDRLGRRVFAEKIVESILQTDVSLGSLVLAIYGSWGSGKSSVKNLIVKHLETIGDPPPLHVPFNPWRWTSEEQLTSAFFDEIGKAIRECDPTKTKIAVQAWYHWSKGLKLISTTSSTVSTGLKWFGVPSHIALLIEWFGKLTGKGSVLAGQAADTIKADPYISMSTETRKNNLFKLMKTLPRTLFITIDDVDRLTSSEIRLLFQLIKANSDFPKMVFLILCQQDIVEHSLAELMSRELNNRFPIGRYYITKVVHLGLTLPELSTAQIKSRIKTVIQDNYTLSPALNQHELKRTVELMRPFFQTPRDIIRFSTSLSFHFGMLTEKGQLDVHALELALLEALRLFEPDVYSSMPLHRDTLLKNQNVSTSRNDLSELSRKENKQFVANILGKLFQIEGAEANDEWSSKRLMTETSFDKFFTLTPSVKAL